PLIHLTPTHLDHLNARFETMEPQAILQMCTLLFPNLYQTTAFGLTGLVILDMLHKLATPTSTSTSPAIPQQPELIFLDTLHHFPETYALVDRIKKHYSSAAPLTIHTYKPQSCSTAADFAALHNSPDLWTTDPERYDFLAKVEPQQRAERDLDVAAVITGRRRSQGGERGAMPVLEVVPADPADTNKGSSSMMIKINPLARWTFEQVKTYIDENGVPYNELLDKGYRSVGDWHSTSPVKEGEGEREGRWKGQGKTECGIHNKKSRYAMFLAEMARKEAEKA
ncbi:Phosphoadenosine phosphosulfate reductase family-domain-containing protein, partial [Microdochium trichocladiopsis]